MDPENFHVVIINDDLDQAYKELVDFIFDNVQFPKGNALLLTHDTIYNNYNFFLQIYPIKEHGRRN